MQVKQSQYNIHVDLLDGQSLIYNSLSRSMSVLDADDNRHFDAFIADGTYTGGGELMNQLVAQGYVVGEETDELDIVRDLYNQHRFASTAITLTICPTLYCNFGCDYCFQGVDKTTQKMSDEVKDGLVNLFLRNLEERPDTTLAHFAWYGGEPLVGRFDLFDLADRLTAICIERGIDYMGSMVSNGWFMNREVALRLRGTGLKTVQITLDGSKEYHDARRHLLSKKGTYDRILSNIEEWIDDVPINVSIRVNIDERNRDDIKELIDDLHERGFAHRKNFSVYFAPVESMTEGCRVISEQMMKKAQYGRLEAELYRHAFNRGLAQIPYPPMFAGVCSALREQDYIVVPCGSVHKCWDTVSFPHKKVGSVFELDGLFAKANPLQQAWSSFDPFSHPTCRSCKILPNCASFCAHKFVHASEAIGEAQLPCPSLKYSIKEKLVMRALAEGHIGEDDVNMAEVRTDPKELCSEDFDPSDYHYEVQIPAASVSVRRIQPPELRNLLLL